MTEMVGPRPLAAAAARLRRPPGRPRRPPAAAPPGSGHAESAEPGWPPAAGPSALVPRLLDLRAAAAYLGVSPWTVRDLEAAGTLCRVRVPRRTTGSSGSSSSIGSTWTA
jgi:hypothetical protein